ncbi:MAG TPA: phage baseplate assembly protein V [Kineosporiaceae bacterium]
MTRIGKLGYVESPGFFGPAEREDADPPDMQRFYGKYRGQVVENVDPQGLGRLLVSVPDVLGLLPSSWAMPCVPMAGLQSGTFIVPPPGAGVWVEFEGGNPDYPIWVGCFWGSAAETPPTSKVVTPKAPVFLVETITKSKLAVSDTPIPPMKGAGVLVQSSSAAISVDTTGVTITAATINLVGTVNINNGALVVKPV